MLDYLYQLLRDDAAECGELQTGSPRRLRRHGLRLKPQTVSSNSSSYWFTAPDNFDQSWLIPYALASLAVGVNILDLCDDAGSGVAYPAGQMTTTGTEAGDQIAFAKLFIGCATEACLSTETNNARQLNIRTEGMRSFKCPSQTFKIGDLVGIYSNGT